jgi:hypothetical protein
MGNGLFIDQTASLTSAMWMIAKPCQQRQVKWRISESGHGFRRKKRRNKLPVWLAPITARR